MTVTANSPRTRQVSLPDGGTVEAPFDPSCGACRSGWVTEIDRYLAEGLTFQTIRRLLEGRSPRCPNDDILRRHISHLPERQRTMRMQLEDPGRSLVDTAAAVEEIVQLGYRRLAAGDMELTSSDWMKALQLQSKIQKDNAAIASNAEWQAAFMAFFEIVSKHLTPEQWQVFQRQCMMSPEIRAVSNMGAITQ